MKKVVRACLCLVFCACGGGDAWSGDTILDSDSGYVQCFDTDSACEQYNHLVEICPNSDDSNWFDDGFSCTEELGYGGYGSWFAGTLSYCMKQNSCALFDATYGCLSEWLENGSYACDGDDWLVTVEGCTDRIDCVEFCQKQKHLGTAGCGVKKEGDIPVCICTDHPENYGG